MSVLILGGKVYHSMKVDSAEYHELMKRWSNEAFAEELAQAAEEWAEHEDNYSTKPRQ